MLPVRSADHQRDSRDKVAFLPHGPGGGRTTVRRRPRAAVAMAVESHKTPEAARGGVDGSYALLVQSACSQRAAASALSSGRVLNAIAASGAALCTALITASNIDRLWGGRRMPAPITTQS